MLEKILLLGAGGLLGKDLAGQLKGIYRVLGAKSADLDIRDSRAVNEYFQTMKPEIVLNAAAMVDVDKCENDREAAFAVNASGAENVARACRETGARLIHFSTDYVFDGAKGTPYIETDPVNPVNIYGQSKLEGERKVLEILPQACVVRISWLFGAARENFVIKTINEGRAHYKAVLEGQTPEPLPVVADQISSPTWTVDIAEQTGRLIAHPLEGIVHAASEGYASRYDLADFMFEEISWDVKLRRVNAIDYTFKAPRPLFTALENRRLNETGINVMRDYREALREFLTVYSGHE